MKPEDKLEVAVAASLDAYASPFWKSPYTSKETNTAYGGTAPGGES